MKKTIGYTLPFLVSTLVMFFDIFARLRDPKLKTILKEVYNF
mgnify:CR=1 FL=1